MSFVYPFALWGLLLVPLLVLAFLFKLQSARAVVSALHLWEKSTARDGLLARFHKLRRWLSLLVALLLLLLCIAAAVRPGLSDGLAANAVHLLLIDSRSAMSATDASGTSLFDRAVERSVDILRQTPDDGRTILATADVRIRIVGRLGASRKELLATLETLTCTGVDGELDEVTQEALQAMPENSTVLVITAQSTPTALADERLFYERVDDSEIGPNFAIREFGVQRRMSDPSTLELFAEVAGDGEVEMDLLVNDTLVDVITLSPSDDNPVPWSYQLAVADLPSHDTVHRLILSLRDGGSIRYDDYAYAVVPVLSPVRVLLVSSGSRSLEAALSADEFLAVDILQPDQYRPSMAGAVDVVLLDRAPVEMIADAGNYLWIQPDDANESKLAVITAMESGHPVLNQVALERSRIAGLHDVSQELRAAGWETTDLVSSQDTAIITLATRGEQRLVRFGLDLDASDLPARVAFPLLIRQSLQWLADAASAQIPTYRTGEEGGVLEPGFYEHGGRVAAASTLPGTMNPVKSLPPGSHTVYPRTTSSLVWQWFAGAALLLLAFEWWAYHRRQLE